MKQRDWIDLLVAHAELLRDAEQIGGGGNGDWTGRAPVPPELASLFMVARQLSQILVPVPVGGHFRRRLHDLLLHEPIAAPEDARSLLPDNWPGRRWLALGSALSLAGLWLLWRRQRGQSAPASPGALSLSNTDLLLDSAPFR